ncbi:MAG: NTP transferase domain-containing protein, partial [Actinomycetia bacterium]|nr:NTP transferase domain-containing protein [Actinomycetes bacterium]
MKAIVMAGGEGSRLRPLTSDQPKPMISLCNKPVMEYIIELLKENGCKDIIVTLQFLPRIIKRYFSNGQEMGVN